MDAVRPSSDAAPSIWYAEVATPHRKSVGKREPTSARGSGADERSRLVVMVLQWDTAD
jgi:hypothetical protein